MTGTRRTLGSLLQAAGIEALDAIGADPAIRGVTLDSRWVEDGAAFFAIRGFRMNGESFAPQAIDRGAAAVFATTSRPQWAGAGVAWVRVADVRQAAGRFSREFFERPDESLSLVGLTGTNGKTTVAYMVEAIARAAGRKAGRIGTTGYAIDGAERPASRTTPEAPELYHLLAEMREVAVEIVAMEVSSHALALSRVAGARFRVAAFLNLSRDHLDFHGDHEAYFEAKAGLFDGLGPDQVAILPGESPYLDRLRTRTQATVQTFGRTENCDLRLREEHYGIQGSSAVLDTPSGALPLRSFLLGRFNMENVAAAAACALALGLPPESIPAGILALHTVPGRAERVDCGQPFTVVVDYAHTEDALQRLLSRLRELSEGAVHVVFGCGGDRDRGKRAGMGQVAAERADRLYLTSDNPRSEDPMQILESIAEGVAAVAGATERCTVIEDRAQAIRAAIAGARPADIVVLAGKGHETTQTVAGRVLPFDDRVVAAEALAELGFTGGRVA